MSNKPKDNRSRPRKENPEVTQPSKKAVSNNPDITQPSKLRTSNSRHQKSSKPIRNQVQRSKPTIQKSLSTHKSKNNKTSSGQIKKSRKILGLDKYQLLIIMFFFVGFATLILLSSYLGYEDGIQSLNIHATEEMKLYLEEQYALGVQDMAEGRSDLARQRFEFIVQKAPNFQEAFNRWVELMVSVPPKNSPTPIIIPTEDLRPIAELFSQANQLVISEEWDQALETLSSLRKADPAYQTVWVDNMMFFILRNRGVNKILFLGQLESGIYDFALAEQFGPLDYAANNYREWARLYLRGNSFWVAYPEIAVQYYSQVAAAAPNLKDESGFTAFYRYWASLRHIADKFANNSSWCEASEQYQVALNANKSNSLEITATYAYSQCIALTPTVSPTYTTTISPTVSATITIVSSPTLTPSPLTTTPTETLTNTPTNSPAVSPTNSLTPTPIPPTNTLTLTPTP